MTKTLPYDVSLLVSAGVLDYETASNSTFNLEEWKKEHHLTRVMPIRFFDQLTKPVRHQLSPDAHTSFIQYVAPLKDSDNFYLAKQFDSFEEVIRDEVETLNNPKKPHWEGTEEEKALIERIYPQNKEVIVAPSQQLINVSASNNSVDTLSQPITSPTQDGENMSELALKTLYNLMTIAVGTYSVLNIVGFAASIATNPLVGVVGLFISIIMFRIAKKAFRNRIEYTENLAVRFGLKQAGDAPQQISYTEAPALGKAQFIESTIVTPPVIEMSPQEQDSLSKARSQAKELARAQAPINHNLIEALLQGADTSTLEHEDKRSLFLTIDVLHEGWTHVLRHSQSGLKGLEEVNQDFLNLYEGYKKLLEEIENNLVQKRRDELKKLQMFTDDRFPSARLQSEDVYSFLERTHAPQETPSE